MTSHHSESGKVMVTITVIFSAGRRWSGASETLLAAETEEREQGDCVPSS